MTDPFNFDEVTNCSDISPLKLHRTELGAGRVGLFTALYQGQPLLGARAFGQDAGGHVD